MDHDDASSSVTGWLQRWQEGDASAVDRILPALYGELHELARRQMKGERADHTLQPTALVHEAYVRLVDLELTFRNRAHFLGMAARTMRRILVEYARSKLRVKRGGRPITVLLDESRLVDDRIPTDVLALDDALKALADVARRPERVIELHYFGGLQREEIAESLGISTATVGRDLRTAKAWLRQHIGSRRSSR